MSSVKWDLAGAKLVASSSLEISTATTSTFDFGTPNDVDLANSSNYSPGDRVLVALSAYANGGSTDTITWVIQDADDSSGSIGTPATAVTSVVAGALATGAGDAHDAVAVKVQPGRPWLRVKVTQNAAAADTFDCMCAVWAVPNNL